MWDWLDNFDIGWDDVAGAIGGFFDWSDDDSSWSNILGALLNGYDIYEQRQNALDVGDLKDLFRYQQIGMNTPFYSMSVQPDGNGGLTRVLDTDDQLQGNLDQVVNAMLQGDHYSISPGLIGDDSLLADQIAYQRSRYGGQGGFDYADEEPDYGTASARQPMQGGGSVTPGGGNPGAVGSRPGSETPTAGSGGTAGIGAPGGGVGQGGGMGPGGEGLGEFGDRGGWGGPGRAPADWSDTDWHEAWANMPDWAHWILNTLGPSALGQALGPLGGYAARQGRDWIHRNFPVGNMAPGSPDFLQPGVTPWDNPNGLADPNGDFGAAPGAHVPDYLTDQYYAPEYGGAYRQEGESIGGYLARISDMPGGTAAIGNAINAAINGPGAASGMRGGIGSTGIPVGIGTSLYSIKAQHGRYGSGARRGTTGELEGVINPVTHVE